jgi:methyl-accepting chemotaxis protein
VLRKLSVKTKISISVLIISMVCSLMIGGFSFIIFKTNLENYMGKRALDIAQTVSVNIDGDRIVQYNKTGRQDEYFKKLTDYLTEVKSSTELTYLYIMVDSGDEYKYITEGGEEPAQLGDTQSKDDYGTEPADALSTGKGTYTSIYSNGEFGDLLSGFAPIFDSTGSAVGVVGLDIGTDIIDKSIGDYLPILFGIMAFSCLASYLFIYMVVTKLVVKPIKSLELASRKLSSCEFDIVIPGRYLNKKDEIGNLSRAFTSVAENMNCITDDISSVLSEMANKNLLVGIQEDYTGDFRPIKDSINHIIETYNHLLINFGAVAQQVLLSSNQVSDISAALAQGSGEQTNAMEELSASLSQVSDDADKNAENVSRAAQYVSDVDRNVTLSNEYMEEMLSAINEINATSVHISSILKVIDDITFQTNILALNAAVEAARAGQAGAGFSVVANEVRTLASRTADAAAQTSALVADSIHAVKKGTDIAEKTAKALADVSDKAQLVSDAIGEISKSSSGQAAAISGVMTAMNQISDVVQNNSARAQESAAASEELSSQAEILHSDLARFKLKDQKSAGLPA